MEKYRLFKCSNPKCDEQFKLYEIYYTGGLNDSGWIEIKCKNVVLLKKSMLKIHLNISPEPFLMLKLLILMNMKKAKKEIIAYIQNAYQLQQTKKQRRVDSFRK